MHLLPFFADAAADAEWNQEMAGALGMIVIFVLVWTLVLGGIGWIIGNLKNQARAGFWLGVLFGPLGWLITALIPENPKRRCKYCLKGVPEGATKCWHCGSTLTGTTQEQLDALQAEKQAIITNKSDQSSLGRCFKCGGVVGAKADFCPQCGATFSVPKAEEPPVVRIPWEQLQKFGRCPCQSCGVNIEFPLRGEGQTVTCPKCGCETVLFNPNPEESHST